MQERKRKAPDVLELRARAGEILSVHGNRLMLIEAIVILLITVMLYSFGNTAFVLLLDAVVVSAPWAEPLLQAAYWLLVTLFTLFFTLPLSLGLLRMSWDMEIGTETSLLRLFSSFSCGRTYLRSLRLSFGAVWRTLLIVIAVALTCNLTLYFFAGSLLAGILCGALVVVEIAVWSLLVLRRFPTLAVAMYEETPLPRARAIALQITRRCPMGGLKFFLRFLPQILLGLLTFGIFLIWEVLPRMCVTYFLYCRHMNETIIRSEEYKKHE